MGLSRTVSEIDEDFSRKLQNFHNPVYFAPSVTRFPLELGIGARSKNRNDGATRRSKKFHDRFSRLDTIPACDGQTDEQNEGYLSTAKTALA